MVGGRYCPFCCPKWLRRGNMVCERYTPILRFLTEIGQRGVHGWWKVLSHYPVLPRNRPRKVQKPTAVAASSCSAMLCTRAILLAKKTITNQLKKQTHTHKLSGKHVIIFNFSCPFLSASVLVLLQSAPNFLRPPVQACHIDELVTCGVFCCAYGHDMFKLNRLEKIRCRTEHLVSSNR